MVSALKIPKINLLPVWISCSILMFASSLEAQDEIDEPAGDITAAIEDSDPFGDDGTDDLSEDSAEMDMEQTMEPGATAEPGDTDEGQMGPVWDSYNDDMKSVAQEVTKGLRVEDVVEPPTEYRYAAFGKPDPFVAPMIARESIATASVSGLEVPIVSPLQRHEISALKLVGIWQLRSGERKALILTPSSSDDASDAGIIVRNGDSVGNRAGKILAIGDSFLTVREFKLAADGTRQYEDIQMLMGARDPSATPGKIRFTPGEAKTQVILEGDTNALPAAPNMQEAGTGQVQPLAPTNSQSQNPSQMGRDRPPGFSQQGGGSAATASTVAPAVPAKPAPIGDPTVTGIAPVAGDVLPPSMMGTAPPPVPTAPQVQSPYLPAP